MANIHLKSELQKQREAAVMREYRINPRDKAGREHAETIAARVTEAERIIKGRN